VTGNPRKLREEQNEEGEEHDKVVGIIETEEEYSKFIRKILELDALEVQFVDEQKETI